MNFEIFVFVSFVTMWLKGLYLDKPLAKFFFHVSILRLLYGKK